MRIAQRIDRGVRPRPRQLFAELVRASASSAPLRRSGLRYTCRNVSRGSWRNRSGWAASHACELGVGGRDGVDRVLDEELELLAEPSPNDRVVAIEAQGHGFARRDLLAEKLVHESLEFRLGRRAMPGAGEACDECVDLTRRDDDAVGPRARARPTSERRRRVSARSRETGRAARATSGQGVRHGLMDGRGWSARQGPVRRSRKGPGECSSAVRGGLGALHVTVGATSSRRVPDGRGVRTLGDRHPGARAAA